MTAAFRIERTRNRHSRAVLQHETIVIRLARNLSVREEKSHIESLVRRMMTLLERDRRRIPIDPFFTVDEEQKISVTRLVHQLNAATLNVPIRRIRLRPMRSQWGSCSSHGDITLNTALLKLSAHLLEYVILHELTHRKVSNHSRAFWNLLESACPRARETRRELLQYRFTKQ